MSIRNNSSELVTVIDSLMNELDHLAASPETNCNELFERVSDTVDAILQPDAFAIFVLGPNGVFYNASRNQHSIESFFPGQNVIAELDASPEGLITTEKGQNTIMALGLRSKLQQEGLLVVSTEMEQPCSVVRAVMKAIAELLGRYVSRQLDPTTHQDYLKRVHEFSLGCMSTLDARELAKVICNDSRLLFACERVQLYQIASGRVVLAAVSSVAVFEKRTALLRCSKKIATVSVRQKKPILSWQGSNDPGLQSALEEYQELSQMPFFAFFPLQVNLHGRKRNGPLGVLLAEFCEQPLFFDFVRTANVVVPQASLALSNAQTVSSIPLYKTMLFFGRALNLKRLSRAMLFFLLPCALLVSALVVRTDFKVRMNGTLRAVDERLVFSPHDAFVKNVLVEHGESVTQGQLLVELRSPDLEFQREEAIAEIQKLKKFKAAKEIALNQATTGNTSDRSTQATLASEIADIEFQINANEDKREHAARRIDELNIFSPISGRVVTWNVQKLLHEKPVRWGDPLLKVANEQSEWELRFKASEKKIGYILDATHSTEGRPGEPKVEYFFQSNPDQKYWTSIKKMAESTEMDGEVGPSVAINCDIDPRQVLKRHGAKVVGDVICGKRPIGYVWTYELVDAIRRQFVW